MNIDPQNTARRSEAEPALFSGVKIHPLTPHGDERGVFTEIFRANWIDSEHPVQWSMVKSQANVLRGVHVHKSHTDYLTVASGHMLLALHDFRTGSESHQRSCMIELCTRTPRLVEIPVGVGHGFYFREPSIHVYGVSRYFDPADEFGCVWNAKELDLDWPCTTPVLSEKDKNAMSYAELVRTFNADTQA